MSCIDNDWLDARIEKTKEQIEALEDKILALETNPQAYSSYTIETAQTRETITKSTLAQLRSALSSLENRLATLCARRHGSGSYAKPGF
jgi:chromosome segregation ATPase